MIHLCVLVAPLATGVLPPVSQDPEDVLPDLVACLDDADAGEREMIYADIAKLNAGSDDPSPKVTAALGEGLEDESHAIRALVLRELLNGQEPEQTVRALLAGWDVLEKDWKSLDKELTRLNGERGKAKPSKTSLDTKLVAEAAVHLERYLEVLGHVPDERIEKVLVKLVGKDVNDLPARIFVGAAKGCLALGSQSSVGAVAALQEKLAKALEDEKIEERYPRGNDGVRRTMDVWLATYRELQRADFEAIGAAASAFAEARSLDAPPTQIAAKPKAWADWKKSISESLPKKLGKLEQVVRVELDD